MLFNLIQTLPDEILNIIWQHISPRQKIFVDKKHYLELNYLIDQLIISSRYDSYIRDIIRKDSVFVFKHTLTRNFNYWLHKQNYKYNKIIYSDYFHFLLNYTYSNNASKCHNILNLQLELSGLKKERHKNSRVKYNKWSN